MVLLDGPCAVNTIVHHYLESSTSYENSTRDTDRKDDFNLPEILPRTLPADFSAVPPFFCEPQPKSAVTGTNEAALSCCKEGACEKGYTYTCATARSPQVYTLTLTNECPLDGNRSQVDPLAFSLRSSSG